MIHLRRYLFLLFFIAFELCGFAKVVPADGSKVHCTTIYFEEAFFPGASSYKLYLATDSLFKTGLKEKDTKQLPAFWQSNMGWGQAYFWRVAAFSAAGKELSHGAVHRFATVSVSMRSFEEVKVKVTSKPNNKHFAGYIVIDNTRSIFTAEGKPVWTMPQAAGVVDDICQVRDVRQTQNNTLTFITDKNVFEMDFDGNIVWKAPNPFIYKGDTIGYHHDFKKDREGNYYVLGKRGVYKRLLGKLPDDIVKNEADVLITDTGVFRKTEISQLIKFSRDQKLLWIWDASDYLKDEDLNYKKSMSGFPNFNTHTNAFSINEQGTMAYVGFRDFSRIVKIDIRTGKAVASYGEKYPSGEALHGNGLFRSQHDASITRHNTILVLNNNGARGGGVSSVVEFADKPGTADSLLRWKLSLDFDGVTNGKSLKGGSVVELANGNLLVCAGELNRIFEVTRAKELVWDAFTYVRGRGDTTWQAQAQYRANLVEKISLPHFMARPGSLKQPTQSTLDCTVYNTGNVPDAYLAEVLNGDGSVAGSFKTNRLKEGGNQKISVPLNAEMLKAGEHFIRLTPAGYPWLAETLKVN